MITEKERLWFTFFFICMGRRIGGFFLGIGVGERISRKLGNGGWEFWRCKQEISGAEK